MCKHDTSRVTVYKSGNLAADVQQSLLQLLLCLLPLRFGLKGSFVMASTAAFITVCGLKFVVAALSK